MLSNNISPNINNKFPYNYKRKCVSIDRQERNRDIKMKELNNYYGKKYGNNFVYKYPFKYWNKLPHRINAEKIKYTYRYGDPHYISYGGYKRTEHTRADKMVNMNVVDKLYSVYGINRMDLMD